MNKMVKFFFGKFIRDCNVNSVMVELYYNHLEFKGTIPITSELYLIKDKSWYVFCIKPDWKKAIGMKYYCYHDDIWVCDWYTSNHINNIDKRDWKTSKHSYDIPEEMKEELLNQISDNHKQIEEILSRLKIEEWYR